MFKQQPIDLGADPYSSPYKTIGIEECENFYYEQNIAAGAKTKFSYVSVPGCHIFHLRQIQLNVVDYTEHLQIDCFP